MVINQLERLKADLQNIDNFISTLKQEGQVNLMKKVLAKRDYLNEYIQSVSK